MSDSASKCPFSGANTTMGARSNQDWWPNQLNLKILNQNSPLVDPMGEVVESLADRAGVVIGEVDAERVKKVRERLGFLADRRPALYA